MRIRKTHIISLQIIIVLTFFPFITDACSVCGGGYTKEQINAYLIITALLAGMAITMMSLLFLGLYRSNKNC